MIKYETEVIEVTEESPKSIICDVCKKEFDNDKNFMDIQEFHHIRLQGGYGSVFGDGAKIECDICQGCLKKVLGEYLIVDQEECF